MRFKYMLRGLGLGILITAAVMGAYTRSAVADARVSVLKEYGLGENNRLPEETTEEYSDEASDPQSSLNLSIQNYSSQRSSRQTQILKHLTRL